MSVTQDDADRFAAWCVKCASQTVPTVLESFTFPSDGTLVVTGMVLGSGERLRFSLSLADVEQWALTQSKDDSW